MMKFSSLLITILATAIASLPAVAQDKTAESPSLFTNVDVFDGVNEQLLKDVNVVVTGKHRA